MFTIGRPWNKPWRLNGPQTFFSHDFSDFPATNPNTFLFQGFFDSSATVSLQVADKLDPYLMLWAVIFFVRIMTSASPIPIISCSAHFEKSAEVAHFILLG